MLGTGLYFSQSQRGEIVGGMGDPAEPAGISHGSTLRFLARFSRALTEYVPATAALKVMRQWAGCYDVTPDNNPILGAAGPANFLQLSGFVGHGFMMAPGGGRAHGRLDDRPGEGRDLRPLHPRPLRAGHAPCARTSSSARVAGMPLGKTIAFLGAGNMAEALVKGLLRAGVAAPGEILLTDRRKDRLAELEKRLRRRAPPPTTWPRSARPPSWCCR